MSNTNQEFGDIKEVIRIHTWKKDGQQNGLKTKDKQRSTKIVT